MLRTLFTICVKAILGLFVMKLVFGILGGVFAIFWAGVPRLQDRADRRRRLCGDRDRESEIGEAAQGAVQRGTDDLLTTNSEGDVPIVVEKQVMPPMMRLTPRRSW
jgi:hypothetical protein